MIICVAFTWTNHGSIRRAHLGSQASCALMSSCVFYIIELLEQDLWSELSFLLLWHPYILRNFQRKNHFHVNVQINKQLRSFAESPKGTYLIALITRTAESLKAPWPPLCDWLMRLLP